MRPMLGQHDVSVTHLMADSPQQAMLELVEPLGSLAQFDAGMQLTQPALQPQQPGSAAADRALQGARQASRPGRKTAQPFTAVRDDQFGGARGGGRAQIRDEVRDREIDFMADTAHERDRASGNGPSDDFFIEWPQIFEGTAAAREN